MANKRNLKKGINFICDNLIGECIAVAVYNADGSKIEEIDDTISSIIHFKNDYIRRISHPEPGMSQKKYYRVLQDDFINSINEVVDNIRNLG